MASERYNFSRFSLLDIKNYLEQKKLKVEFIQVEDGSFDLRIIGTDVCIRAPSFTIGGTILTDIYWKDYPRTEQYEKSKKIYHDLVKRFGVKKGEPYPTTIKDYEKMKQWIKDFRKRKKIWFFSGAQ